MIETPGTKIIQNVGKSNRPTPGPGDFVLPTFIRSLSMGGLLSGGMSSSQLGGSVASDMRPDRLFSSVQSWTLEVFLNFFNNKNDFLHLLSS